jgi:hypothetical protein
MKNLIIITCAGEAQRYFNAPKQLLMLKEEKILERIIRQCRDRGQKHWIIAHDKHIISCAHRWKANVSNISARRWLVETVLSTSYLWDEGDRVTVLLGDVIYSKECMDRIFACLNDFTWFGDLAETFAIVFRSAMFTRVKEALQNVIDKEYSPHLGTLRQFFHAFTGWDDRMIWHQQNHSFIELVGDYTADVDTLEDYQKLYAELVEGNRLDDEPKSVQ